MSLETVTLTYDEFGNPDYPPVIILHGFFASSGNWRHIAKRLAGKFHVYVLNLRNHGSSPHHREMDYPCMAADIVAFLDARGLQRASLIGHSMGGKVAMWFALNNPRRIDKLLIVDIAPVSYRHNFTLMIQALMDLPLHEIYNRKQAEELLTPAIPQLSLRQFHLQNLVLGDGRYRWRIDLQIFARNAAKIAAFPDVEGIIPYAESVLFITGGNSLYILPDYVKNVYALFPDAKIQIINNTGHWLHAEKPQRFLQLVFDYFG